VVAGPSALGQLEAYVVEVAANGARDPRTGSKLTGALVRVDLSTGLTTKLFTVPTGGVGEAGILRIGASEVYAVADVVPEVLHVVGSTVTTEAMPSKVSGLAGIAEVPGMGMLACSGDGQLFQKLDGPWTSLGQTGLSLGVCTLRPFAGGVVFSGDAGLVGFYSEAVGLCPAAPLTGVTSNVAFQFGSYLLLGGDLTVPNPPFLSWVVAR
jgi:hypothetical protein